VSSTAKTPPALAPASVVAAPTQQTWPPVQSDPCEHSLEMPPAQLPGATHDAVSDVSESMVQQVWPVGHEVLASALAVPPNAVRAPHVAVTLGSMMPVPVSGTSPASSPLEFELLLLDDDPHAIARVTARDAPRTILQ
jgi:hypothetical protein